MGDIFPVPNGGIISETVKIESRHVVRGRDGQDKGVMIDIFVAPLFGIVTGIVNHVEVLAYTAREIHAKDNHQE